MVHFKITGTDSRFVYNFDRIFPISVISSAPKSVQRALYHDYELIFYKWRIIGGKWR